MAQKWCDVFPWRASPDRRCLARTEWEFHWQEAPGARNTRKVTNECTDKTDKRLRIRVLLGRDSAGHGERSLAHSPAGNDDLTKESCRELEEKACRRAPTS